jgi:phage major head subunit gpT-like protein
MLMRPVVNNGGYITITPAISTAIRQNFQTIFNQAFKGVTPWWPKVAMRVPSTTSKEIYAWLSAFPKMREWLGDRVIANLAASDMEIVNKDFELTIEVDRNEIEDERIGLYNPIISMGGDSCAKQPDELIFPLMTDGFDHVCFDGQYFFDTDHPHIKTDGTTENVSNDGGGGGNPWFLLDLSRPVKPFIFQDRRPLSFTSLDKPDDENVFYRRKYIYGWDSRNAAGYGLWQLAYGSKATLDSTNYAAYRAAMGAFKKDMSEQPLGIVPTHLVCGPASEAAARAVLIDERLANGQTNTWRNTAELIVVPWLP